LKFELDLIVICNVSPQALNVERILTKESKMARLLRQSIEFLF
jgi:hypothetical protein